MPPGPVPLAVADALLEPPDAELTGMEGRGKEEPVEPSVVVSVKEKVVGSDSELCHLRLVIPDVALPTYP